MLGGEKFWDRYAHRCGAWEKARHCCETGLYDGAIEKPGRALKKMLPAGMRSDDAMASCDFRGG